MKKKLVIAALAAAVVVPASAQAAGWAPTGPTDPEQRLNLSGFADGSGLAAFSDGVMLHTTDYGSTWQPLTTPPPGGQSIELRMGTPAVGWGLSNGVLSRTTDTAATWTQVAFPPDTDPAHGANGISGLGTTDAGRTVAFDVDAFTVKDGCPYPLNSSTLATSHDGGATWTRAGLPYASLGWRVNWRDAKVGAASVFGLHYPPPVRDGDTCSTTSENLGTDLLVTEDGGVTWRKVLHDDLAFIAAAWTKGGRLVTSEATGEVRVSDDLGRTFRQTADLVADDSLPIRVWSIDATPAGRVYAFINGGGVAVSDDSGATWTKEASLFEAPGLAIGDIAAFDAEHAVAGGPQALSTRATAIPAVGLAPAAPHAGSIAIRDGARTLRIDSRARAVVTLTTKGH